ncbi:unnamed protein product [Protopolystoma xenopodis]|uniref:Uncharacterized protein n=1 Tax=Protopolystoma xenopodis TaxID=117903 RepID=A0A3S5ASC2_9PLAT|nr:unnamed protein product [Protopolystoma xenopodis]
MTELSVQSFLSFPTVQHLPNMTLSAGRSSRRQDAPNHRHLPNGHGVSASDPATGLVHQRRSSSGGRGPSAPGSGRVEAPIGPSRRQGPSAEFPVATEAVASRRHAPAGKTMGQSTNRRAKSTLELNEELSSVGSTSLWQLGRSVRETVWNVPDLVSHAIVFGIASISPLTWYIPKTFRGNRQ